MEKGGEVMKRLITLLVVVLLAAACAGRQAPVEKTEVSFIDSHCRQHAGEYLDYTPELYNECVELHTYGLVKTDSLDGHLNALHYNIPR